MGIELTILAFQRAKIVHAFDRTATVIGSRLKYEADTDSFSTLSYSS
jgi:hypothetical protein